MAQSIPYNARSTADQVLAGVDLTGKRVLVTGCNSGLGFETMNALAANGAVVLGLARTAAAAAAACARVALGCVPVACDLADLDSVAAAARTIREAGHPLDSVVANAGIANLPSLNTRYDVELQFLVNHLGHFALINQIQSVMRGGTGRIVIVSSSASIGQAPREGIMFDNLDGRRFYEPRAFYGQSKLAAALYAKELSRRLLGRGIAVNSLHPGATKGTAINQHLRRPWRLLLAAVKPFMRDVRHAAATQALLAASPRVAGITGEYWANCQVAPGNPLLADSALAARLWDVSERFVAEHTSAEFKALPAAA
jgi:WW domain-containing oxidoreductase